MSHSQFHGILFILRHAWLNLWDKHMTTGRINQVTTLLAYSRHRSMVSLLRSQWIHKRQYGPPGEATTQVHSSTTWTTSEQASQHSAQVVLTNIATSHRPTRTELVLQASVSEDLYVLFPASSRALYSLNARTRVTRPKKSQNPRHGQYWHTTDQAT